ncbi:MAG: ketohexokinase [Chromatiaceae bacterium]|nr:ketohexokinase [Chromatiaceae bacterium]
MCAADFYLSATPSVLGVGIATLDLVHEVAEYPHEDQEVRALARTRRRGGNVTNTLAVLAQFGSRCAWLGTLAEDEAGAFILEDLGARGIDTKRVVRVPGASTPLSCIALSRASASRTIVHYRDLRELAAEDFARVPLAGLDWLHFEGRNPVETARMMARARCERPDLPLSLELEKPRPDIEQLYQGPAVLLVGRAFARAAGFEEARACLAHLLAHTSAALCVLAWGEEGAWFVRRGNSPRQVPAWRPERLIDTLGAGDCFNAGVIQGLLQGLPDEQAVARATRLASFKCGMQGFDGVVEQARAAGLV